MQRQLIAKTDNRVDKVIKETEGNNERDKTRFRGKR